MKASQISNYGGTEVHALNDVDKPSPGEGRVLVEVHAAGVNPFDGKLRAGLMKKVISLQFPAILGGDVSGVVAQVGPGVNGVSVGDEVYGSANAAGGAGSFAEYVTVSTSQLAAKPKSISFVEAGALPLTGASAYQAIVEHLGVSKNQKVLIHGGAGGIGSIAIQIAKHLGAHVATTVGPDGIVFAKQLGAEEVIDYHAQDFENKLRDFDAVLDTVGGDTTAKSLKVLRPGGVQASMALYGPLKEAEGLDVEVIAVSAKVTSERLQELTRLVDQGVVRVTVDTTFPLEQAGEAITHLQEGHPRGKVVIIVKS